MIILQLINSSFTSLIYFLPIYFVNELHFNITLAGLLVSSFGLGTLLGGPIGGNLADYISSKKVVMYSLIIQVISFLSLSIFNTSSSLILTLFLLGISTYSFITSNFIWALSYAQNEMQRLVGG